MSTSVIQVESNLRIRLLDGSKVVDERVGHNIFLDLGREWLAHLVAYESLTPPTPYPVKQIRFMGVGIGGTRQLALSQANAPPLVDAYPGSNSQTDINPKVIRLERPVRVTGSSTIAPSYSPSDVWLGQVQAPPEFPTGRSVTFRRSFGITEVSYAPYLSVPLSEVALFTGDAMVNNFNNTPVAYDTFDTLSKTDAFDLEIAWTLRF